MPERQASVGVYACIVGVLALCLAGCDCVFQLLEVSETGVTEGDAPDAVCPSDDFSATAINSFWRVLDAAPVTTVTQTSGNLVFTLGVASGSNYALIGSGLRDLTHDAVSLEWIERPSSATSAEAGFSLELDGTHRYSMFIRGFEIVMRMTNGGANQDSGLEYSTSHRFMRLRHVGEEMLWETSADRVTWPVRRREQAALAVTSIEIQVFAGTFQSEGADPGKAVIDNLVVDCSP